MTYDLLRSGSGVQWPCTEESPTGTERLYVGGAFRASPGDCESYGKDLVTGAPVEPTEYRALNPDGKAVLKAAEYLPAHEVPSADYPFHLITGRTIYHFHTRTKTGRAAQLQAAAPEVWVEASQDDAEARGWSEGDLLRVETPRGAVEARLRVSGVRRGVLFVPFHFGYWDANESSGHTRAANELTLTDWDPVSKQPLFKTAAARAELVEKAAGVPSPAPTTGASRPIHGGVATRGGAAAVVMEELQPTGDG
jgi:anaerobic selenocysteine-containing dehydrogenase